MRSKLKPLANLKDLAAFNVDYDDETQARIALDAASSSIRNAAASVITKTTSTVQFATEASRRLELPARPVWAVKRVLLDGLLVAGWRLVGSHLWRDEPWQHAGDTPSVVEVTFTHGLAAVPSDIIALTCSLTAAGIAAMREGYDPKRGISYERIGDYQYGMTTGDQELLDPFQLPDATAQALAKRFRARSRTQVTGSVR